MPKHIPSHLKTDRELRDWAFARIDELEHEIALYRADQAHEVDDAFMGFLAEGLGLPRGAARTVIALYRSPVVVTKPALWRASAVGRDTDDRTFKSVDVYVCRARQVMGDDIITTVWGVGYVLTPKGRRIVDGLKALFDQLRAAA